MFKQVYNPVPNLMHIGLSLSGCITDLILNRIKIEQVACIVTGTSARNGDEWEKIFKTYAEYSWHSDPARAIHYARYLKDKGLLIQPRLLCNTCSYNIAEGYWLVQD